jgi:large conductance mechanosensitive channel
MLKELKSFLMRDNVVSLATGVIIGTAFQKIVESIVNKIFMPLLGIIVGGLDFSKQAFHIMGVEIGWGEALQAIINFIIMGTILFLFLRAMGQVSKVVRPETNDILEEILEELRKGNHK